MITVQCGAFFPPGPYLIISFHCPPGYANWLLTSECTVDTYSEDLLWKISVDTYSRLLDWTLTEDTYNGHLQLTLSVDTYSGHLHWTLTVATYSLHFSMYMVHNTARNI